MQGALKDRQVIDLQDCTPRLEILLPVGHHGWPALGDLAGGTVCMSTAAAQQHSRKAAEGTAYTGSCQDAQEPQWEHSGSPAARSVGGQVGKGCLLQRVKAGADDRGAQAANKVL